MRFETFEKNLKILQFIPIALLIVAVGMLAYHTATTGSPVNRGVEFTGGKLVTIEVTGVDVAALERAFPDADISLTRGVTTNLIINIPIEQDEQTLLDALPQYAAVVGEPTITTVGPALGEVFFQQALYAIITAFIIMSIVVFLIFRSLVPSSIVVFAAATDIVSSLAISNALGIKFSLPVLVALLTLIGYSVDTDILLTTEVLKSGDTDLTKKIKRAMKTGLTLTGTMLVALSAIYFVTGSYVLQQMAAVLIIGLVVDIFATWLTNAGLLRAWVLRKEAKKQ